MCTYYNGNQILNTLDIRGEKPELYLITSNKSYGKTTFFTRRAIKRFMETGEKTVYLYRRKYELDDAAEKVWGFDSRYPTLNVETKKKAGGVYVELIVGEKGENGKLQNTRCFGYATSLSMSEKIKTYSHLLNDCVEIIFDEFQLEEEGYLPGEIQKFLRIHTALGRGYGMQVRYLPVIMLGNYMNSLNPYFVHLGISERMKSSTKIMRGDGFVAQFAFGENVSRETLNRGMSRAFSGDKLLESSYGNKVYFCDRDNFIEKVKGKNSYYLTIVCEGNMYAVKFYHEAGFFYIDDKADKTFPVIVAVNRNEHTVGTTLWGRGDPKLTFLRRFFQQGLVRFKDGVCRSVFFNLISY